MNDELLKQVYLKLNITWEDEDTRRRIEDIINSAIPNLIHKLGITDNAFDFSKAGIEHELFLSYCLYEYNHCLNEFDDNYSNLIAQTRQRNEVAHYLMQEGNNDE